MDINEYTGSYLMNACICAKFLKQVQFRLGIMNVGVFKELLCN